MDSGSLSFEVESLIQVLLHRERERTQPPLPLMKALLPCSEPEQVFG